MTDVESGSKEPLNKNTKNSEKKGNCGASITSKIRAYAGVISFSKYFGGGFFVWSVGHWQFSYGWLLSGIVIYTLYKCYKKDKKLGIEQPAEIIDANDTNRIKDLPHWVSLLLSTLLGKNHDLTQSSTGCLFRML